MEKHEFGNDHKEIEKEQKLADLKAELAQIEKSAEVYKPLSPYGSKASYNAALASMGYWDVKKQIKELEG